MSTNKQALRECFEKWWEINYHNGKPPRFGWEYWRDGEGYQIDDDESDLDGMWESWQAAHSEKLEAAEKRIAELSAPDGNPIAWESTTPVYIKFITDERYQKLRPGYQKWYKPYRCSNCAAGITVKGE